MIAHKYTDTKGISQNRTTSNDHSVEGELALLLMCRNILARALCVDLPDSDLATMVEFRLLT